ncbi:Lrp/AsnC family transcriptional regulator [Amycolatopsis sp. WQ 127309]|uniref:Lrp/AsnC family transcriptional regulator n=1 Tax=Amycolatopsis sp. WQ 127309 TaxID=2932773 RepID=UPI001FF51C95|nr:Lrp/AsnC family transcriptional regulator [Amycolatopsis sp. WQ 127309]UOZ08456.1 Lrp/AsnC family transcriptional regulator [Amycolatopsis sp. WQ 127309]
MNSDLLDELDRRLAHALQLDGRASFSTIAEVLGVSDQTIARRYRKLRSSGVLRVVGVPEAAPLGQVHWLVRLRCVPDAAAPIATALARRADTQWVSLMSGGTEIVCFIRAPQREEADGLLLGQLPRTPRVVSMTAYRLLRRFAGGPAGWPGRSSALPQSAVLSLRRPTAEVAYRPEPEDPALLAALAHDGRADMSTLSAAAGRSESTTRRRLEHLRDAGALYFDVEIDAARLGYSLTATLWLTVAPSALSSTGRALAQHPQVAFAAATTGPSNLVANVGCRDDAALYEYLADDLGGLSGVQQVETAPMIRTLKRFGTLDPV